MAVYENTAQLQKMLRSIIYPYKVYVFVRWSVMKYQKCRIVSTVPSQLQHENGHCLVVVHCDQKIIVLAHDKRCNTCCHTNVVMLKY